MGTGEDKAAFRPEKSLYTFTWKKKNCVCENLNFYTANHHVILEILK